MFSRGLAALILTFIFSTQLCAEYLYKDEVIDIDAFAQQIEEIGGELKQKTGIGLYLVIIKELEKGETVIDFEKTLVGSTEGDSVFLTFVEFDKKVDIYASSESLYKYFDKEQVLSVMPNTGTIIPLLVAKAKDVPIREKYAAALTNGYADIAEQIADSKGIVLDHAVGSGSRDFINLLRLFFYGMIAYGLYLYIKRKYMTKKRVDE